MSISTTGTAKELDPVAQEQLALAGITHEEEWANFWTHLLGLMLSLVGAAFLMSLAVRVGESRYTIGCAVFSATMVAVYAGSTLSHAFYSPRARAIFRTLDQALIYLFITGTYTPLALQYLQSRWWSLLTVAMWCIAVCGFLSKVIARHRVDAVSTALYVVQGWLPALGAPMMMDLIPKIVQWWILAGGLSYTLGVLFLRHDRKVRYFHAVWHVLVIAGSACHLYAIAIYGLERVPRG